MVEMLSKKTAGDFIVMHCCDGCAHNAGAEVKRPAESGSKSLFCGVCNHFGIGSQMICRVDSWLKFTPLRPANLTIEPDGEARWRVKTQVGYIGTITGGHWKYTAEHNKEFIGVFPSRFLAARAILEKSL